MIDSGASIMMMMMGPAIGKTPSCEMRWWPRSERSDGQKEIDGVLDGWILNGYRCSLGIRHSWYSSYWCSEFEC